jgi:PP-loop superfamily ATP-utilizing enzyme
MSNKVICWWSGGITSAVACKISIDLYGKDNCRVIFIDTNNEHEDTYRFMKDCSDWYGIEIETIRHSEFNSIEEVWIKYKALNNAKGAVCSSTLKRTVREKWEKKNEWKHQVFGFDLKESKRAIGMVKNHSKTKPIFPLMMYGLSKEDCIKIVVDAGLKVPKAYILGYLNNNCLGDNFGCTQGGIGYWQKIYRDNIEAFNKRADLEHKLTDLKGKPVTMLKDQSKDGGLVFLKPHKDYPNIKDISMMKGREPKPLVDCNGFCGVNDLDKRSSTEDEINYDGQLNIFDLGA